MGVEEVYTTRSLDQGRDSRVVPVEGSMVVRCTSAPDSASKDSVTRPLVRFKRVASAAAGAAARETCVAAAAPLALLLLGTRNTVAKPMAGTAGT